jgi:tetratricopeptide (TPR) repeat protein
MSVWIQTASVAPSQIRSGLSLIKIILVVAVVLDFAPALVSQQVQDSYPANPEARSGEIRTLPSTDSDRIRQRDARDGAPTVPKSSAKDDTCLLPPLTLMIGPTVAAEQLQIPPKAKKDYQEACANLKDKKTPDAEKRLRKAVQEYPKYPAAWVTLGQVLAAQQRTDDARSACSQASTADPRYVPAYLCLADIALRAHDWGAVLKLSSHALQVDPSNNPVAYEYHAAANLNLHNLADAEKSGLRAVEIDRDHHEPRVYFVLAQVYEAKGDPANEAVQLREYLKYASNPDDVAIVKQYLSELEKQAGK